MSLNLIMTSVLINKGGWNTEVGRHTEKMPREREGRDMSASQGHRRWPANGQEQGARHGARSPSQAAEGASPAAAPGCLPDSRTVRWSTSLD